MNSVYVPAGQIETEVTKQCSEDLPAFCGGRNVEWTETRQEVMPFGSLVVFFEVLSSESEHVEVAGRNCRSSWAH